MAKKRANGEGSIRKKAQRPLGGQIYPGHRPGHRPGHPEKCPPRPRRSAKKKLAKAIRKTGAYRSITRATTPQRSGAACGLKPTAKPNIRYNTAKGYEGIIEHHIIPAIGAIKLKQLSSIHIQRMYNDLKENGRMHRGSKQNDKPLSNTFVRRVHAVLQAALKQAVKERLIPYNPCENCRIPPRTRKR